MVTVWVMRTERLPWVHVKDIVLSLYHNHHLCITAPELTVLFTGSLWVLFGQCHLIPSTSRSCQLFPSSVGFFEFCFGACKWDHTVFVFLHLDFFTQSCRSIHLIAMAEFSSLDLLVRVFTVLKSSAAFQQRRAEPCFLEGLCRFSFGDFHMSGRSWGQVICWSRNVREPRPLGTAVQPQQPISVSIKTCNDLLLHPLLT